MHYSQKILFGITSFFLSNATFSAAFQFYELGTSIIGTAGVGQAAVSNDASTSYFNPAGMTQLAGSQYLVGTQLFFPEIHITKNNLNTFTGDNGGNAGALVPGGAMYYVGDLFSNLKMGVSFTSPYGGLLNYSDGWIGRFNVEFSQFYVLNLNPSIAYQLNDWLSLGLGFAIEYANLRQTTALPAVHAGDGQINVKVHDFSPGFNAGVLFSPTDITKIGIAYRSQIKHNMSGNISFLRIASIPSASTEITTPHNVILSLSQGVTENFNVLAEAGWANWASMKASILVIDGLSAVENLNWNNTYRLGLGGQYSVSPCTLLQAGVSYDSSPTTASRRLPNLPMDKQYRIGAGVIISPLEILQISFSYEYVNFGRASIHNVGPVGILSGDYSQNYANIVQSAINVAF